MFNKTEQELKTKDIIFSDIKKTIKENDLPFSIRISIGEENEWDTDFILSEMIFENDNIFYTYFENVNDPSIRIYITEDITKYHDIFKKGNYDEVVELCQKLEWNNDTNLLSTEIAEQILKSDKWSEKDKTDISEWLEEKE